MLPSLLLAATIILPGGRCADSPPPLANAPVDSSLVALYESGVTFEAFVAAADDRKAQWERHRAAAIVPADVLATARSLKGRWRLLVVAVDSCSDSVNTIPYLARLIADVPAIDLRIVTPEQGRAVMEAHRTPDGRPATPTVLVLDAAGNAAGCWVERPASLQAMAVAARKEGTLDAFARDKQSWYDRDAGASTVREVVAVLASAEGGAARCDAVR